MTNSVKRKILKHTAAVLAVVMVCPAVMGLSASASSEIAGEQDIIQAETGGNGASGEMTEGSVLPEKPESDNAEIGEIVPAEASAEIPVSEFSEEPEIPVEGAAEIPALQTVLHNAYISGVSADKFQPDGSLTRAQAAQLLYNLLTDTTPGSIDCEFSDVASGSWYFNAVTVLASYGVLNGYADGTFRPNNSITRAEFIKIIVLVAGAAVAENGSSAFPDVATSHWACDYIAAAAARGWIGGYEDGTFHPNSGITRAEAVTVLNRVLGRSGDETAEAQAADALKFTDVKPGSWYYRGIMEAAIPHTYTGDSAGETWLEYERSEETHTGWTKLNDIWFYYDSTGVMQTGWLQYNGNRYYLGSTGAMCTGLQYIEDGSGGNTFCFNENGAMQTGWQDFDGTWYYFSDEGKMLHGEWLKYNSCWYYFLETGAMAASQTVAIDGKEYSFNANGSWIDSMQLAVEATAVSKKTSQLVVVVDHQLTYWQKDSAGRFVKKLDTYCGYGSKGLVLGTQRVQGSNTTPIGCYPLTLAFGTGTNPGTNMTYRQITAYSYWSAESNSRYNTWVESRTAISGEHLIDYYQYKYAMVIGYNMDPAVYGRGSAIFLHCKSTDHWSTGGCVSITESEMLWLMKQLSDGAYIIIVPDQDSLADY